jgi:hypothetical protein
MARRSWRLLLLIMLITQVPAALALGLAMLPRQALGETVRLGAALRYGLRRALRVWGWSLLASVIIVAGISACLVPGVYFAFVLSLVGPVVLFERGSNPIGRSFRMFHNRFGMVLGRVALVALVVIVGTVAVSVVERLGMFVVGVGPTGVIGFSVGTVAVTAVAALLNAPIGAAQLIGLVVTYAEQRGHEAPVGAGQLAAELG